MGLFEPTHLIIVLLVVLVLFGGKKIPELMRGVGQGMGELQRGLQEAKVKLNEEAVPEKTPAPLDSLQIPATGVPVQSVEKQNIQA